MYIALHRVDLSYFSGSHLHPTQIDYPSNEVGSILRRSLFCKPCQKFRKSGDRDRVLATRLRAVLHCSGCQQSHPRVSSLGSSKSLKTLRGYALGEKAISDFADMWL